MNAVSVVDGYFQFPEGDRVPAWGMLSNHPQREAIGKLLGEELIANDIPVIYDKYVCKGSAYWLGDCIAVRPEDAESMEVLEVFVEAPKGQRGLRRRVLGHLDAAAIKKGK